jgi:ketosteroid isomerase-like protein
VPSPTALSSGLTGLLVLAALLLPRGIQAQRTPGFDGGYDEALAEFRAERLREFDTLLTRWLEAVQAEDVKALMELYAEDAFVHLGEPVRGEEAIEGFLTDWLPKVAALEAGLADFEASGRMSYATVNVRVHRGEVTGPRPGTLMLVTYRGRGGTKIRSQFLVEG